MKAPKFSAYAPDPAAMCATVAALARPDEQPTTNCPQCHGAGCQHDQPPGQPVSSGDIYECYHCEGTGQVPAIQ